MNEFNLLILLNISVIKIDLKEDCLKRGKSKYEKLKSSLQRLNKFTVILIWEPSKQDVCPSSIAKYFSNMGYKVEVNIPRFMSNTLYATKVPQVPFKLSMKEDIIDFIEWLGMVSIDGDLESDDVGNYQSSYITPEPNEEVGQVKFLQWKGLFSVKKIKRLLNALIEHVKNLDKPWISVYVQGFSDSPVAWDSEEHNYYTNGDNAYLTIFNKTEYLLCMQKCSNKQYT
ncbi:hypothetical protein NQ315_014426 [Exocentrus adspersus]|uniref:Uncharacterized protein n=1 Tax=Exocentrus adspersus TaxID=1586481 RepID=A0AAV8VC34_9CUCU|nr:hypothetical protein NQ315_014426 [Exocentrus adspersus]